MNGLTRLVFGCLAAAAVSLPVSAQTMVPRAQMLSDLEWQAVYDGFTVDPAMLEVLKERLAGTRLEVVFAFWCGDSRQHVPPLLKLLDQLGEAAPEVRFIEVARKSGPKQAFYDTERRVERVPTFIVYREGKEIGRIVEKPQKTLFDDLLQIVF